MADDIIDDNVPSDSTPAPAPSDPVPDPKPADPKPEPVADPKPAEDWRVKLAGDDPKELKRLSRYATEADAWKAYRELEKKQSTGELKKALPKDATAEDLAQWRKENGIPETPDKYDIKLDNGIVIGEEDKPLVDKYLEKMHGANATPAQAKAALETYYELLGQKQAAIAEADSAFKDESLEHLRAEWGGDFKKNLKAVNNLLAEMPEETREAFNSARTADGRVIGNDPAILKWLAAKAYELNPAASIMPSSMSNPSAGIEEEIAQIEKTISTNPDAYWKGDSGAKMQARYTELLAVREKIKDR